MLHSHFCIIFFLKYILCNALFLLLTKKIKGLPTFLGNLKRVAVGVRPLPLSVCMFVCVCSYMAMLCPEKTYLSSSVISVCL